MIGSSPHKLLYDKEESNLNLRLGVSFDLNKKGLVRVAYQRRSTPGFLGELEPIGCAGLIPPTFDIEFNEAQDVQGSVEYELTDKTFVKGSLGYQKLLDLTAAGGSKRAELSNLLYNATHWFIIVDDMSDKKAQLWYGRFAVNQILDRHFSFSLRYNYNNSKFLDGSGRELPGIPKHSGDASLVFVHPWQIQLSLRESYTGKRYADRLNAVPLKGYFSTDFSAQKEFLNKRLSLSFSLTNLFDQKYETLRHPFWWYAEALPAKGRTLFLRGEYRF
jgi:outer membrane receptor protein involved in Fe transport